MKPEPTQTDSNLAEAVRRIEASRTIHVDWAERFETNAPDDRDYLRDAEQHVGDVATHKQFIVGYDLVLQVLRQHQSELAAVRTEAESEMVERLITEHIYHGPDFLAKSPGFCTCGWKGKLIGGGELEQWREHIRALSPDPDWLEGKIAEAIKPLPEERIQKIAQDIFRMLPQFSNDEGMIGLIAGGLREVNNARQTLKETEGGSHAPSVPRDT